MVDYDDTTIDLFRDIGGVDELIKRLEYEIETSLEEHGGKSEVGSDEYVSFERNRLLKALINTLIPCLSGRLLPIVEGALPRCLAKIFSEPTLFGGSLYGLGKHKKPPSNSTAASIMSGMIHSEPTIYSALHDTGLPEVFLKSINPKLLLSSEALCAIPIALGALCLNQAGSKSVADANPFPPLFAVFTSKEHTQTLGYSSSSLGASMDELARHHPSLKDQIITQSIQLLENICSLGSSLYQEEKGEEDKSSDFLVHCIEQVSKVDLIQVLTISS